MKASKTMEQAACTYTSHQWSTTVHRT